MSVRAEARLDLRKSTRFGLRCKVSCTWRDAFGVSRTLTGVTHDISAGGLFIVSGSEGPSPGILATVDIELPSHPLPTRPGGQHVELHGIGRVVRIVHDGLNSGFGIAGMPAWSISRNGSKQAMEKAL